MTAETARPAPPIARRDPLTTEQVGRTRTDPYHWLRADNWQEVMRDPSVLADDIRCHLEAENTYTKALLEDPTDALRETLIAEMRGRIKEDDSSVPEVDGPYAYYTRFRKGGEYPLYCRRDADKAFVADAPELILFDGEVEGQGKAYFDIGSLAHSPDHKWLACAVDELGSEYYTIRIRNAETGEDRGIVIKQTTGEVVWSADAKALYWVLRNENGRSEAVYRRHLDTDEDELVYREEDSGFFVGVGESQSGEVIFISANDHTTSEYRWLPAGDVTAKPKLIAARERGHEYDVEHFDGGFVITTNHAEAVDFKLMTAPMTVTGPADWAELVPHRPGTLILDTLPLKDHLIRLEREGGLPRLVVRARETGQEHTIAFDEAAYALGMSAGYRYDTTEFRFSYESPATPGQVFDYDIATGERALRKTREVPSGHNPADYVVERIMAPAQDGAEVPVTLLRHVDTPTDGTAPLLLYGYGSYGITIPASFSTGRLSLVDRGFIYAIAHIRGSKAKGYQWYLDGKLKKKVNTFSDYVAAGRHLCAAGYTSPGRIVGHGGSAGGLLMGAAVNLDPELFAGIMAAVPFVDVLNTMSDDTLPLTPPEWPEWGNPLESAEDYDTILAYSPYDQVTARPYPPMLITGGLSDPRVTYWEPAKWAAKLRHEAPDAGPFLLHINMEAGHGGATGRFEGLKETAREYAFALAAVGLVDSVTF